MKTLTIGFEGVSSKTSSYFRDFIKTEVGGTDIHYNYNENRFLCSLGENSAKEYQAIILIGGLAEALDLVKLSLAAKNILFVRGAKTGGFEGALNGNLSKVTISE